MQRIIWWLRRDFRLSDNTALFHALRDGASVIPLFVLDESLLNSSRTQGYRLAWLLEALAVMDGSLRQYGAGLVLRRGAAASELLNVVREADAQAVYFNRDYSEYARHRDQQVAAVLAEAGITVKSFRDLVIHEADEVRASSGKQYEVYSPYRRAWANLPKPAVLPLPAVSELQRLTTANLTTATIPTAADLGAAAAPSPICPPGEQFAQRRLGAFIDGLIYKYGEQRNAPGLDGTSLLSPYLRWGMISPRICYQAASEALVATNDQTERDNVNVWIGELVWREFNYQILEQHPHIVRRSFRAVYDDIEWSFNAADFSAWQQGETGYPIVDAAMRQLNATGWMHNRTRMIVASFLCKDLLIDWRLGEQYFMQRLLDGEVANNAGNWQWVAGTGTDAAPYFRIFNPTSQGQKFDPQGAYIRRWVPELAAVPDQFIHAPASMAAPDQVRYNCRIGRDYPVPIVDHAAQRDRALAMYSAARAAGGQKPAED